MTGFPAPLASKMGNLIVNPGSSVPGALETYLREWRWWTLSMAPFTFGFPGLRSGADDNAVVPGVAGRYAFEQFLDQGRYVVGMRVTGAVGVSGAAPSGVAETRFFTQLRANTSHLFTNVHTPNGITRSARLVLPDATTVDFEGQFALSLVKQTIADCSYMLDVTVPEGRIA